MSTVRIDVDYLSNETPHAKLVKVKGGGERWVPNSVIEHESWSPMKRPTIGMGKTGYILVAEWWAQKRGIA